MAANCSAARSSVANWNCVRRTSRKRGLAQTAKSSSRLAVGSQLVPNIDSKSSARNSSWSAMPSRVHAASSA